MVSKNLDLAVRLTNDPDFARSAVITDPWLPDNPIVFVSDEFARHTGYSRQEVLGRNCRFLQGEKTDLRDVERFRHAIATRQTAAIEVLNYTKDRREIRHLVQMKPIFDPDGSLANFVAIQVPIVS